MRPATLSKKKTMTQVFFCEFCEILKTFFLTNHLRWLLLDLKTYIVQKMKFSIEDFFSKCDQIRRKLRIWSHLLKKSLTENFIFWAVWVRSSARTVLLMNHLYRQCHGKSYEITTYFHVIRWNSYGKEKGRKTTASSEICLLLNK